MTVERLKDEDELPGVWTDARYRQLLALLDFEEGDELPAEEVPEMTLMAMQDVDEPHDAAEQVLDVLFGEELSAGMRQQIAHKFDDAEAWEEHGDMSQHARIFAAADILHRAYPKQFVRPTLGPPRNQRRRAQPRIQPGARRRPAARFLGAPDRRRHGCEQYAGTGSSRSSWLAILSQKRPHILWQVERADADSSQESTNLHLYSSWNWFGPLKGLKQFESTAHPDEESSD